MNIIQKSVIYETARLILRGLCLDDIEGNYFHWFDDQEVCRFNSHGLFPNTKENMIDYINSLAKSNNKIVWAIIEKISKTHIGNVTLQSINWINRTAEFAIIMGEKEFWGKGYAKESSFVLLNHGFTKLNLHSIYCFTAEKNEGMKKLALSLGMKYEGKRREHLFIDGEYLGQDIYGIIKNEYKFNR